MDLVAHLRALVAVADQGGFTRGAEHLGVPQPVVSRRVAALERELGGRLLERAAGARPTSLGARVLPYARDTLADVDRLLLAAREERRVVIALPTGLDPRDLAALLVVGRRRVPGVRLIEADQAERQRLLTDREADLAVISTPPDEADVVVELGVATGNADPAAIATLAAGFHADRLRRDTRNAELRRLHLDPEDDVPWLREPLVAHLAGCGLSPAQLVVGTGRAAALLAVHSDGDAWVCPASAARQADVDWQPWAGLTLRRGYRIARRPGGRPEPAGSIDLAALAGDLRGPLRRALGPPERRSTVWDAS